MVDHDNVRKLRIHLPCRKQLYR